MAQVPRVVVGEVAAPRLRRAPSRARREARQPGEVGDQLVTTVRAVVEARAGVQLAGPAGAGEGGEEERGEDGGEEGREQQGGEQEEGGLSKTHVGGGGFLGFCGHGGVSTVVGAMEPWNICPESRFHGHPPPQASRVSRVYQPAVARPPHTDWGSRLLLEASTGWIHPCFLLSNKKVALILVQC